MKILSSLHENCKALLNKPARIDGRIWVLAILLGYFLLLSIFEFSTGWYRAWERFGVSPLYPPFADLRVVLAGFECTRLGYDAQLDNPCDPWRRPCAYPHFWLALTPLGLDQSHAIVLGFLLALLFYISAFNIMGKINFYESLVYSLILCSPPVMWIVERGNVDIIIFFLLTISLILITRSQRLIFRLLGYVAILITAFLKMFPIFGLVILLRERRKHSAFLTVTLLAPFVFYWLSNLEELRAISKGLNLSETWNSFGYKVIFLDIIKFLYYQRIPTGLKGITKLVIVLAISIVSFLITSKLIFKMSQGVKYWLNNNYELDKSFDSSEISHHIDSFRLGASLYTGAFLMGTVYDYKLSFMIFSIPQILHWVKGNHRLALISNISLLCVLATLYLSPLSNRLSVFRFDELINWFLLGFFAYSFTLSLPRWLQLSIRRTIHRILDLH
jgi:hypothetical protein